MDKDQLKAQYRELLESFRRLREKESKKLFLLSFLRLLVFISGTAFTVAGFLSSTLFGLSVLLVSIILFLTLIKLYSRHSYRSELYGNLVEINRREIKALSGDYSELKDGSEWIDPAHDFSNDIDMFGRDSLFQYLNRTITGYGRAVLAGWLSDPYSCSAFLSERQETIRELSGKLTWRQEFTAYGFNQSLEKEDIKGLLEWLNQKLFIRSSVIYRITIILFPSIAILSLGLLIAGFLHYSVFSLVFLINLLITLSLLRQTNRIHNLVSKKHNYITSFKDLLSSFENENFDSAILSGIKNDLTEDSGSAIKRIESLSGIVRSFDSRLNMFAGFVLNGLLLWDLQCINSLEKWKMKSERLLPKLLAHIGEIDAFNSLANYAFNNPGFSWPLFSDDPALLSGQEIGHPLLPDDRRVCNDFRISNRGQIIIITGANMAGKSTFLRTIAVNYILAMTGAPVCARSMRFRAVKLFTSMRTTDSLSHNESYFYAELKRLKILMEKIEADNQMLFILDEILKGTNSADKSSGSKLFIMKCLKLRGTGLIATHDTSLAETERDYPGIILNKCFEIEINGEKVSFDYKIREGITTRMNASLLMREMGIAD